MKLIIENIEGSFYIYPETEKHFKKIEKLRLKGGSLAFMNPYDQLADECDLIRNEAIPKEDYHLVFDIKKPK